MDKQMNSGGKIYMWLFIIGMILFFVGLFLVTSKGEKEVLPEKKLPTEEEIAAPLAEEEKTKLGRGLPGQEEVTPPKEEKIVPKLSLEDWWTPWNGLNITVKKYEEMGKCRGSEGAPAPGAKLIYIWVAVKNVSEKAIEMPSILVYLTGIEKHSGWFGGTVCRYDDEAFGNACFGRIYPGITCEGWELFEVPQEMQVKDRFAKISTWKDAEEISAEWLLNP